MNRNRKRDTEALEGSGFSLYQLGHLNQNLNSDCEQTHRLRQQIKLEKSTYGKLNKGISESINKVEVDGTFFASKLEEQRHKYETLSALVEHYEQLIYEEKVSKYEEMKNQKAADEYEKWRSRLKQTEKNYDQIVLKANSSSYEVTKKIDQVRTLRSERTILNGLFDQFERELFEIELKYKQMVIERSFLENAYKERTQEFEYIERKAEEEEEKIIKKLVKKQYTKEKTENHTAEVETNPETHKQVKIKTNSDRNESTHFSSIRANKYESKRAEKKSYRKFEMEKTKTLMEIEKIEYEKKVKDILYNLEVKRVVDIPECIEAIEHRIATLYAQADHLYENIYRKQAKFKAEKDAKSKSEKSQQKHPQKSLIQKIEEITAEKDRAKDELTRFQKSLTGLKDVLEVEHESEELEEEARLVDEKMVVIFPNFHHRATLADSRAKPSQERLNQILSKNKTTKTTGKIYSEEDLIVISKFNLREESAGHRDREGCD